MLQNPSSSCAHLLFVQFRFARAEIARCRHVNPRPTQLASRAPAHLAPPTVVTRLFLSDFGRNDVTLQGDADASCLPEPCELSILITVVTHLGNIIKPGDICAGYDLTCAQFNDEALESYQGMQLPEVVLVKKGEDFARTVSSASAPLMIVFVSRCFPSFLVITFIQCTKSPLAVELSSSKALRLRWRGLLRSA
jgi:hypothetical protein